jgi:hypothetical protein
MHQPLNPVPFNLHTYNHTAPKNGYKSRIRMGFQHAGHRTDNRVTVEMQ